MIWNQSAQVSFLSWFVIKYANFCILFSIGVHLTGGSSLYFFQDVSTDELREELPAHQPRYPFYVGTHMGRKSQHSACHDIWVFKI